MTAVRVDAAALYEQHRRKGIATPAPPSLAAASFTPIDLAPVIAGRFEQPKPTMMIRKGTMPDIGLIYAGEVNSLWGESNTGKSWATLFAIAEIIRAGGTAMLIDLEDTELSIVSRLRYIGIEPALIAATVVYVRPQDPFGKAEVDSLLRIVAARRISLVVIDSVGEAFGLNGLNENNDHEVTPWFRSVARRLADAGPAVLLVDHPTKSGDAKLDPSGSKRKRAAITGAGYLVEAVTPFVKGAGGRVRFVCAKDRHGNHRRGETVAWLDMIVDLSRPDEAELNLIEPALPLSASTSSGGKQLEAEVLRWLETEGDARSMSAIETGLRASGVKASNAAIRGTVDLMAQRGDLTETKGAGGARMMSPP